MSDELVKIGALWKYEKSYQGRMGDARLVVLPNNYKQADNHPDYIVYVSKPKKREEGAAPSFDSSEEVPF